MLRAGYTKAGHIVRAVLESMAFQTRDVLSAMAADAEHLDLGTLAVDGGATANDLLMQIQVRPDSQCWVNFDAVLTWVLHKVMVV